MISYTDHFQKYYHTCKLFLLASLNKLELFTAFDRFLVSSPSSRVSCNRKKCRPTANLRKASPSVSSLSRERRSWHFSVVRASKTYKLSKQMLAEKAFHLYVHNHPKHCLSFLHKISNCFSKPVLKLFYTGRAYSMGGNFISFREWSR